MGGAVGGASCLTSPVTGSEELQLKIKPIDARRVWTSVVTVNSNYRTEIKLKYKY